MSTEVRNWTRPTRFVTRSLTAGVLVGAAVAGAASTPASAHGSSHVMAATNPQLKAAVAAYARFVDHNVTGLISHTKTFCAAVDAGHLTKAKVLYPKARVFYERIEPVAVVFGALDTDIDGRIDNPVTKESKFMGFHRLEQLLWTHHTTRGGSVFCGGLVHHERQLKALVNSSKYTPIEIASGATDLIDEASTSKITGEEERYSKTDFVVFVANVQAAQEVVRLFTPYIEKANDPILVQIAARHAAVMKLLATYRRQPGYDDTGYVNYRSVRNKQRQVLSGAVNAYAEALSSLTTAVTPTK